MFSGFQKKVNFWNIFEKHFLRDTRVSGASDIIGNDKRNEANYDSGRPQEGIGCTRKG
jgi:hypothetical protein